MKEDLRSRVPSLQHQQEAPASAMPVPMAGADVKMEVGVTSIQDSAQEAKRRSHKTPSWLIDPRNPSSKIGYWDATTGLALIFTAIVTPPEVAFMPASESALEPLFVINRMIDGIFFADIFVQFLLIYCEAEGAEGARWVEDPRVIAIHYLRGWFALDALSIGVSSFDIIAIAGSSSDDEDGSGETESCGGGGSSRVVRALRLIKLVRRRRRRRRRRPPPLLLLLLM